MLGIIYFLLSFITGFCLLSLAVPEVFTYTGKSLKGQSLEVPPYIIVFPGSFIAGTLVFGWISYALGYVFAYTGDGLKYADAITMTGSVVFIAVFALSRKAKLINDITCLFRNMKLPDIILTASIILLSTFIAVYTFNYHDNAFYVGFGQTEDFAVHLGIIRSFSHGNNFPTQYPLFAGSDMRYHFMFQFFTANLEKLGLRLDIAFNLMSIVSLSSELCLLYTLAIKLFGKRSVGILSIVFTMFRSGLALFLYIGDLIINSEPVAQNLINRLSYIGFTSHEYLGIYNVNVYACQRHLAFGMSILLFALLMFIPEFKPTFKLLSKDAWIPNRYRIPIVTGILLGLSGFFNGACVIGCLIILFVLAVFSENKLEYAITALITCLLVIIQSNCFTESSPVLFRFEPGYIIEDTSPFGVVLFFVRLFGVFLFLLLNALYSNKGKYRWILIAFLSPLVFAFLFKLTVEATINHKYIIIATMLCDIFIADLIATMLSKKSVVSRVFAVILVILMTATGLYDLYTFTQANSARNERRTEFRTDNPVTIWLMDNTKSEDICLSYSYSLTEETIAGTSLYYGYSYTPWGAGYDIYSRYEKVCAMFSASDAEELISLCEAENIRYIIIDDNTRNCEDYDLNEELIADTFECVFSTTGDDGIENIYDTRLIVSH